MNKSIPIIIIICLSLSSCVKAPTFSSEGHALIKSNYPIVTVNGIDTEATYQLDIEAGENTLVIVYNTYQYDYYCTFNWAAEAGISYEVTDQENAYPLTLYRWYRKNGLWAIRMDAIDPLECKTQPAP